MKNKKHSIYYKFDADTCVRIHYLLILFNSLVLGGGTIALMWIGMLKDNNIIYILSLMVFVVYLFTRYIPGRMLQSVLYLDCDAKKMKEIVWIMENKVKYEHAKTAWKYMRVQATSYISGCEQESFQLLECCEYVKKTFVNQLTHLSLYLNYYSRTRDWDNYKKIRMELETLPQRYVTSKKGMDGYEIYMKGVMAKEKYVSGEIAESRKMCQELLNSNNLNMLNQVAVHSQLAKMDMEAQQYDSAKVHLDFVIEHGGTTYYVEEAKQMLNEIKDR